MTGSGQPVEARCPAGDRMQVSRTACLMCLELPRSTQNPAFARIEDAVPLTNRQPLVLSVIELDRSMRPWESVRSIKLGADSHGRMDQPTVRINRSVVKRGLTHRGRFPCPPLGTRRSRRRTRTPSRSGGECLGAGRPTPERPGTIATSVHDLLAAVDAEHLGGDVAVGHQIEGAQRAVLGVADAADGQALRHGSVALLLVVGVQQVVQRRVA
jgi:hypothetical protein